MFKTRKIKMSKINKLLAGLSTSSIALFAANASAAVVVCACGRAGNVVICVCQAF